MGSRFCGLTVEPLFQICVYCNMAKIPYGISDFSNIATEGYYFVDRTNYCVAEGQPG